MFSPLPSRKVDANPVDDILDDIRLVDGGSFIADTEPAVEIEPEPDEETGFEAEEAEDDYSFAADDDEVDTVEDDVYC